VSKGKRGDWKNTDGRKDVRKVKVNATEGLKIASGLRVRRNLLVSREKDDEGQGTTWRKRESY